MLNRTASYHYQPRNQASIRDSVRLATPRALLVEMRDGKMQFGEHLLWQAVNFTICTGEFVALIGANGTGKTTLLQSLLKQQPLSGGQVILAPQLAIGYVPQLKNFDPKLPIRGRDLIRLGLDGKQYGLGRLSWFGFGRHKAKNLSLAQKNYRIDKAIDEVGGRAFADAPLNMLSGGEQQRMRIAQALVSEPDLLLMDEPLLSLDVASQQVVCEILAHRKQAHATAILMISHELVPIVPLVDKVVLLQRQSAKVGGVALMPQGYLLINNSDN